MKPIQTPVSPWRQLQEELWNIALLMNQRGDYETTELVLTILSRINELLADETAVVVLSQLPPSCWFELRNLIGVALRSCRSNRAAIL